MEKEPLLSLLMKNNPEELEIFVNSNGKSKAYSPIEIINKVDNKDNEREVVTND